MSFFDQLILNIILIMISFSFYIVFSLYRDKIQNKKNEIILDIACLSSCYLLIHFDKILFNYYFILLINIPLIVSVLYKRNLLGLLLIVLIILHYVYDYGFNLYLMILFYGIFYLLFFFLKIDLNRYKNIILFIAGVILSIIVMFIFPYDSFLVAGFKTCLTLFIFYLTTSLCVLLIKKGEELVTVNHVLVELEREKQLKNSLFKITHEVKNPISVALGYLTMMDYKDVPKIKKYNGIIESEIKRAVNIMDDFNSYSKIKVVKEEMDLIYLLEDTITSMKSLFDSKNVSVIWHNSYEEIIINGDYNRLKQVFVNIFKNSVESIDSNGEIKIDVILSKRQVSIKIRDNGCGIKKEDLDRIGDMLYTTKNNGTGIGVCMSKEIILEHGGYIKYTSEEGVYTLAEVVLYL